MIGEEYPGGDAASQDPGDLRSQGVLSAYAVSPTGRVQRLDRPFEAKAPTGGYLWLHLSLDETTEANCERLGLAPVVTNSLIATETRPRTRHLKKGSILILRGVNLNEGARPEDMLSLRCWIEPGLLVTVRKKQSLAVNTIRQEYDRGEGFKRTAPLLMEIVSRLIDLIDPVVDGLADSLDACEQDAQRLGANDQLRDTVSAMRHDATIYRRYLAPMRDAVTRLGIKEDSVFSSDDLIELQEEADRLVRVVEELDITIERAQVIVDQMAAIRSERMNRNMMLLSVVSAVFLPLGFLTGLLGINVGGLPGQEDPRAFAFVVLLCLGIGGTAGVFFKARDWI
ncbi:zinc transporter ZntB [Parvularcula maris]|uniref:Zinc transporter ZntB n=1 Tax=Parvularcula maris TaxID=2965077 RepID=A0A9X2RIB0_9PROT|nr:zinc transporter ZntB [Parvularcula maris]MCQ8185789.1 zinc transporter ZntB [Parvularcula maris]